MQGAELPAQVTLRRPPLENKSDLRLNAIRFQNRANRKIVFGNGGSRALHPPRARS
jgi:hypothetical protein